MDEHESTSDGAMAWNPVCGDDALLARIQETMNLCPAMRMALERAVHFERLKRGA